MTSRFSIYHKTTRVRKAKNGEICHACQNLLADGEIIHVTMNKNGVRRRHVRCAIQKNVISLEEAKPFQTAILR